MKKKAWAGVAALVLVLAIGTSAYAAGNDWSFEEMFPQMKQMHPNFTDTQLEDMYQSCHGENEVMKNANRNEDMRDMMGPAEAGTSA